MVLDFTHDTEAGVEPDLPLDVESIAHSSALDREVDLLKYLETDCDRE